MPELSINGTAVQAARGQTVLQAALAAGFYVPTFCWHPNLSVAGNCRMCVVEVEGDKPSDNWLDIACNMPVTEGMRVRTDSPAVKARQQETLQFILLNHPVDCGICDKAGECLLQDAHYEFNGAPSVSTVAKVRSTKYVQLSERIVLDNERCILCTRCVRFTRELSRSNALGVISRGDTSLIRSTEKGALDADPYSDNVVDLCPVGALLSRAFLHQARVWYLQPTDSVCPGCARGCRVQLWTRQRDWRLNALDANENRRILRVTPHPAQAGSATMPGPWICNWGRDLAQHWERPRATQAMRKGVPATVAEAIAAARALLEAAARPAALISSAASNEELDAFAATLAARLACHVKPDRRAAPGEVIEDGLLICADKNPNTAGAQARFDAAPPALPADCDLVLVWGEGVDFAALPRGAKTILLGAVLAPENGHADVFIPLSIPTERAGSYTNVAGEVHPFAPCQVAPAGVIDAEQLFVALSRAQATA